MKNLIPFLLIVMLLSGCTMSRMLSTHRSNIKSLTSNSLSEKAKFDGLANELADVLDQALTFERPSQKIKYLRKFSQQNSSDLQLLLGELNPWIQGMSQPQQLAFAGRALLQPYGRKLTQLVPKVQKLAEEENADLGTLEKLLILYQLKKLKK